MLNLVLVWGKNVTCSGGNKKKLLATSLVDKYMLLLTSIFLHSMEKCGIFQIKTMVSNKQLVVI